VTGCRFAHDDGAYVLGALAPAERAAYERHLTGCAPCREAVAEIAVLPGLLSRLDPAGLEQIVPPPSPASRLPGLLATAGERRRHERRRGRWRYAAAAVAAVVALVVGFGLGWRGPADGGGADPPGQRMVAMRPVGGPGPVHAEISLTGTGWGTEIRMRCGYDPSERYAKAYTFRLVAYGPDGASEQIGSWLAAPGDDVRLTGATRFTDAELVRVELVRSDGSPVLHYELD
jgi:hypothetical protein